MNPILLATAALPPLIFSSTPVTAAGKPTVLHLACPNVTEGQSSACAISKSGGNGKALTVSWTADNGASGSILLTSTANFALNVPTKDDALINGTRQITVKAVSSSANTMASFNELDNDVLSVPTPQPAPTPTPIVQSEPIIAPSLHGLPDIASNFDVSTQWVQDTGPADIGVGEGAFRMICTPGQVLADDPIVFPGQPGKSHLHQFYGNTGANAYSTYESLRTTGESTCQNPLNRSGYWMPALLALLNGKAMVVRPDYINVYYKKPPPALMTGWKQAPDPSKSEGIDTPLPNGLRFTFGWDPTGKNPARTGLTFFQCETSQTHYDDIKSAALACPVGKHVGAIIEAPNCWNGTELDTVDHRSHVSYATYDNGYGYLQCDAAHPHVIPAFTLKVWFLRAVDDDVTTWHFSSDEMLGAGLPYPGYTFHADWFGAWDNTVSATWQDNCLKKVLSCNTGQTGDGRIMKMFTGFSWTAVPHTIAVDSLVPTPVR